MDHCSLDTEFSSAKRTEQYALYRITLSAAMSAQSPALCKEDRKVGVFKKLFRHLEIEPSKS